jgi:hypothetical protein
MCVAVGAMCILMGAGATKTQSAAKTAATKSPTTKTAAQWRADWKMPDLKIQKEAIDDATFAADVKKNAMASVDWFLQQQETLISQVQKSPQTAAAAQQKRTQLEAQFKQKMAPIYNNATMMAEVNRRMKALNSEMDTMASSADQMFAKLDAVGLTADQKAKLKPIVQKANQDLKSVAAKAPSKSHRDAAVQDEAVTKFKDAKQQIKQALTPAQRAKLDQQAGATAASPAVKG